MMNVLSLPVQSATQIEKVKITEEAEQSLITVLTAFKQWRKNKKSPSEPIPEALCRQIFSLEAYYPSLELRRFFNLSTRQYQSKREKYFPNGIKASATESTELETGKSPKEPPKLCEIKIKPGSAWAHEPLPSAKTLVVEFCRSDGKIMKIHTTQDSIPTLIHTFFEGQ